MCSVHKLLPHHQPQADLIHLLLCVSVVIVRTSQRSEQKVSWHKAVRKTWPHSVSPDQRECHLHPRVIVHGSTECVRVCVPECVRKQFVIVIAVQSSPDKRVMSLSIFTLNAILRNVINHLWQCVGEPVRNGEYQGQHRSVVTGMYGYSKWNSSWIFSHVRQSLRSATTLVFNLRKGI